MVGSAGSCVLWLKCSKLVVVHFSKTAIISCSFVLQHFLSMRSFWILCLRAESLSAWFMTWLDVVRNTIIFTVLSSLAYL